MYLCLGLIGCFAISSAAQNPYRGEVFGSVGVVENLVIFGTNTNDINFGGGVGVRPFSVDRSPFLRMLGFEIEANGARFPSGSTTPVYLTGNVLVHLPLGRAEPYLVLGGGLARQEETHGAGDVGVGAKIFVTPQVSLRPELRVFLAEYVSSFPRISVAVGYHW